MRKGRLVRLKTSKAVQNLNLLLALSWEKNKNKIEAPSSCMRCARVTSMSLHDAIRPPIELKGAYTENIRYVVKDLELLTLTMFLVSLDERILSDASLTAT